MVLGALKPTNAALYAIYLYAFPANNSHDMM